MQYVCGKMIYTYTNISVGLGQIYDLNIIIKCILIVTPLHFERSLMFQLTDFRKDHILLSLNWYIRHMIYITLIALAIVV